MNMVLELLLAVSMIGALDVLYFHLYKHKLYAHPASVWEEVTHLSRHVIFLAIVAMILFVEPATAAPIVASLFVLDLFNTAVDVWLERGSRQALGGLSSAEYLLHVLASIGLGAAIATLWWRHELLGPLTDMQLLRGGLTLSLGGVLLLIESALFGRAICARRTSSAKVRSRCCWCLCA